jgi:hypothetical protein
MKLIIKVVAPKQDSDWTRNVSVYTTDGKFLFRRLDSCVSVLKALGIARIGNYVATICEKNNSAHYLTKQHRVYRLNKQPAGVTPPYYTVNTEHGDYLSFISGSEAGDKRTLKLFNNAERVYFTIAPMGD